MPEPVTPATESAALAAAPAATAPPAAAAPTTPATWDELFKDEDPAKVKEALANSRKWETRAKENKAALDAAAPKLTEYDKLVEASKTDAQRLEDAAKTAQTEAETAKTEAARLRVALKHGLDDKDLRLLTGTDAEMDETATYLAGLKAAAAQPGTPRPNPAQGSSASGAPDLQAQIAQAEKAGDVNLQIRLQNQKLLAPLKQ